MKLSKETLSIFKNFSAINPNLTIKPGSKIVTISAGKNIIAEAIVGEQFPSEFGIYDLNEFLGAMSLFPDPELIFGEKFVTVREDKNEVKYFAADSKVLTPVPSIKSFPSSDIDFELSSTMLMQIQRVSSILKVGDFRVVGDGKIIKIQVGDKSNPTGNTYESEVGETDKEFRVNLKVENLKLLNTDYQVSIGGKKIARFVAKQHLTYYIALELDSSFNF